MTCFRPCISNLSDSIEQSAEVLDPGSKLTRKVQSEVCSLGLLGILFSSLDTSAVVVLGDSGNSADGVAHAGLVVLSDSNILSSLSWSDSWKDSSANLVVGSWSLKNLSGGVVDLSLLWLALLAWEEDQLGLVGAKSFSVELQLLSRGASSSVVHSDSNSAGEGGGDTGSLEFIESESTTIADLSSVLAGGRRNDWAKFLNWSWAHCLALGISALSSSQLGGWLIEVAFCSALPVFAEMYVRNDVVVLDHC